MELDKDQRQALVDMLDTAISNELEANRQQSQNKDATMQGYLDIVHWAIQEKIKTIKKALIDGQIDY